MVGQALTDVAVRNLTAPRHGQIELWDTRVRGFGVRVSHGGAKAFVLVYRFNGRPRRITLGRYPTLGLAQARELANQALRAVDLGKDPGAEKTRARRVPDIEHFDAFVDHFIETYARPKNRTADETSRLLRREFVRVWKRRPIKEIRKHDVTVVLDDIMRSGKHTTANRSLAAIRKLFNWAVERGLLDQSPCANIGTPAKSVRRDRILSDNELKAVWNAVSTMGYPYEPIVKILILTAQRREEVAGMQWQEIDSQQSNWSMGAERTKSDRPHVVPLTGLVTSILTSLPRLHERLVFPSRGNDGTVSGFSKWKSELDEISEVEGWRLHDIRRTTATGMARLGVPPHVVERILNHTSGTFGGVAGIYNRFGYLPEMREALDRWSHFVVSLVDEQLANNETP